MSGSVCTRVDYPDEDVRFRVTSYLGSRHLDALKQIAVEVQNGTVCLTGKVGSYYEKQVALSSCQRVAGVLTMVDHLEVSPGKPPRLAQNSSGSIATSADPRLGFSARDEALSPEPDEGWHDQW